MFTTTPHNLSDAQFGLLLVVVYPLLGGSLVLYNAYRMGRLKWKPSKPANPRLVTFVILLGIILIPLLLSVIDSIVAQ
jgi:hypothetical protein